MPGLRAHLALAGDELARLEACPLSVRHALLVAALIDRTAELAFAARAGLPALPSAEDILAFRAALKSASPPLGRLADLCGMGPDAPRLSIEAVPVPAAESDTLTAAEFMVSLYNGATVPRVVISGPAGTEPALPVLTAALSWWRQRTG